MSDRIECPRPAYDRIVRTGLAKRILESAEKINEVFLCDDIQTEEGRKIIKQAWDYLFPGKRISDRWNVLKDILILNSIGDSGENSPRWHRLESNLIAHPSFLSYLVLGDELFEWESFGFPNQKSLEESITSFCIGERKSFQGYWDRWVWRGDGGDKRNEVIRNIHGDLYVSQTDVSGRDRREQTLFGGVDVFDTFKVNPEIGAIHSYQDWSEFLVSLLKYARTIGRDNIPEIVSWGETLEDIGGGLSGNYAEAIGFGSPFTESNIKFLMERQIPIFGERETNALPLIVSGYKITQVPVLKDGRLCFYRVEGGNGQGEQLEGLGGRFFEENFFTEQIVYDENDLPDALKATYKYFARERFKLPMTMEHFLSED